MSLAKLMIPSPILQPTTIEVIAPSGEMLYHADLGHLSPKELAEYIEIVRPIAAAIPGARVMIAHDAHSASDFDPAQFADD